jgi:hypothetical protein
MESFFEYPYDEIHYFFYDINFKLINIFTLLSYVNKPEFEVPYL